MNDFPIQNDKVLEQIIEHYKRPKHKEILARWTYKQEAERPMCGDDLTVYILMDDDVVKKASYDGVGCNG